MDELAHAAELGLRRWARSFAARRRSIPEPFTGERLTAAIGGQVQIEHYHRYLFARSLVPASTCSMSRAAKAMARRCSRRSRASVIGVEHSGPTVRGAAGNFPRPNLRFLQGDARALPLADACVDAVVSFETIEHFDRQDDFLREVRRVLRPDGSFIVSTPDRDVYSPAGTPANPFHVRELSRSEFTSLLHGTFRHVQLMQQRALIGSALLADTGSPAPPLVFDRRGDTHFEACIGLPRAPYLDRRGIGSRTAAAAAKPLHRSWRSRYRGGATVGDRRTVATGAGRPRAGKARCRTGDAARRTGDATRRTGDAASGTRSATGGPRSAARRTGDAAGEQETQRAEHASEVRETAEQRAEQETRRADEAAQRTEQERERAGQAAQRADEATQRGD